MLSYHLDHLQDHQRGRELAELVLDKLEQLPLEALTGQRGIEFVGVIDDIAKHQLQLREFDRARASYERALAILDGLEGLEPRMAGRLRASIFHQLGEVAQAQRRFAEAEDVYKRALEIFVEFNDRRNIALTYHQLGNAAYQQRRLAEVEDAYRRRSRSTSSSTSATAAPPPITNWAWWRRRSAALRRPRRPTRRRSRSSLNSTIATAPPVPFTTWVGWRRCSVASPKPRTPTRRHLRSSSNSTIHSAAMTFRELGIVAQAQRRFTEAEDAYKKALGIFVEFDDAPSARVALHSLARLWRATGGASISSAVATILKVETGQATELLEQLGEADPPAAQS